ncbi:bZIP transcription protein [Colletotrichum plurivorum]|uniref:BZIP transcription protein n=1 Tax=Colletotrichum plurivorum TaxID=2175906 RepID=A0A8H6K1W8_9PEZI|nr:bZIP transcription protein [Colletotrichum plurivorum]
MASDGPSDDVPTSAATPGGAAPAKAPPSEKEIARKLRKRELDRRAQRQARERTRNRIAELEAQVKELRKDDSTRLSACMEQLATVTRERDRLADTLKTIERTIRDNVRAASSSTSTSTATSLSDSRDAPLPPPASSMLAGLPVASYSAPMDSMPGLAAAADGLAHCHGHHGGGVGFGAVQNGLPATSSVHAPSVHAPSSTPESLDAAEEMMDEEDDCHDDHDDPSLIVPPPEEPCDCVAVRTNPTGPAARRVNVWRAVNSVLAKRPRLPAGTHLPEDGSDEDIPVRALLEGWDAVARSRPLSRLWKKLRRVDELCFSTCPPTERLAILRTMHLLLQYHSDPTPSRYAKLPTWYLKRPSQAMPHSYAIDFFVWPGVRERFVFGQHHYCNNQFWELFGPNFHMLWPYEFRDAYKKSVVTGQYQISPMFEQRISDINSWTMGVDFFTRFPELIADIPAFHSISQSLTPVAAPAVNSPPMPQQASLSQLKERDQQQHQQQQQQQPQQMLLAQHHHESSPEAPPAPEATDPQTVHVYPQGIYNMLTPAFMEEFIPQGYDTQTNATAYGPLAGYF